MISFGSIRYMLIRSPHGSVIAILDGIGIEMAE